MNLHNTFNIEAGKNMYIPQTRGRKSVNQFIECTNNTMITPPTFFHDFFYYLLFYASPQSLLFVLERTHLEICARFALIDVA